MTELLWLSVLGVSIWAALAAGASWAESHLAGGLALTVTRLSTVMASLGFTWCYGLLIVYVAVATGHASQDVLVGATSHLRVLLSVVGAALVSTVLLRAWAARFRAHLENRALAELVASKQPQTLKEAFQATTRKTVAGVFPKRAAKAKSRWQESSNKAINSKVAKRVKSAPPDKGNDWFPWWFSSSPSSSPSPVHLSGGKSGGGGASGSWTDGVDITDGDGENPLVLLAVIAVLALALLAGGITTFALVSYAMGKAKPLPVVAQVG